MSRLMRLPCAILSTGRLSQFLDPPSSSTSSETPLLQTVTKASSPKAANAVAFKNSPQLSSEPNTHPK
ncbi:MAG TPA: hypothetical protein EYG02_13935 [Henriciella marina]|nr:hypothetical protein [Henriciella sp.]HIK66109.1 hypothetical protein [Henriciella marina]